jgi:predicted DNA-binding transcriptional regulator AlpA
LSDQLFSERELSKIIGRSVATLQKDRAVGGGVPFIKIGRLVRYRGSDIDAFIAARPSFTSTSEADTSKAAE